MQSQKRRIISVHFQRKPFNITVIQVYARTSNAEEAEVEWFCEDLQDLAPWKESYEQPRQHIKKQRHYFANKDPSSQSYGFSGSHVWM